MRVKKSSKRPAEGVFICFDQRYVMTDPTQCLESCVCRFYLTYCMFYVWKRSTWIVLFQRAYTKTKATIWPTKYRAGAAVVSTITKRFYSLLGGFFLIIFLLFFFTKIISRNSRICPDMTSTYPNSARVHIGKYLQLQHAVSIPEKISICLNRGHEESMDYYYTLRAEATSNFFLQLKLECSSTCRSPAHTAKM